MTTYKTASKTEESLKEIVKQCQEENSQLKQTLSSIQASIEQKDKRIEELEESQQWQELQHQNQLNSKEAKIQELKTQLKVVNDVGKLQRECEKIYHEKSDRVGEKMAEITAKARDPHYSKPQNPLLPLRLSKTSHGRLEPTVRMEPRSLKLEVNRSKIFRHKLQETSRKHYSEFGVSVDTLQAGQPPMKLYSHENPPSTLGAMGLSRPATDSKPTLPPIGINSSALSCRGYDFTRLAINGDLASKSNLPKAKVSEG